MLKPRCQISHFRLRLVEVSRAGSQGDIQAHETGAQVDPRQVQQFGRLTQAVAPEIVCNQKSTTM